MSLTNVFAHLFRRNPPKAERLRPGRRLGLELLEGRLARAVTANLSGNLLTVNLDSNGDTATIVGTDPSGSDISVSGTGLSSTPFTGVNSIAVTQTPGMTSQSVTFQTSLTNTILATGGSLSVAGIATTTVNGVIAASTLTGNAPTVNVQSGNGATIQVGVDLAGTGATVNVANGTYIESNILVPTSLTIAGQSEANVLVEPAFADSHTDSDFGGTIVSNGFVVQANNVTIQDVTLDGNANSGLSGTQNFRAGIITDSTNASAPFSGLTVQDVTVANAFRAGIEIATPQPVSGAANQLIGNTITGVSNTNNDGTALSLLGSAVVTGNTLGGTAAGAANNVGIGANVTGTGPNPVLTVQGNTLTDNGTGMNLVALGANSLIGGTTTTGANTIAMNGSGEVGIIVTASTGAVTVQGNQITGSASDAGIWLQDNSSTAATTVQGNTLTSTASVNPTGGSGTGIYVFDDPTMLKNETGTAGPDVATLIANTITGFVRGIDLNETSATSPQSLTATLDGNTLTNDTTGIRLLQSQTGATVTATFQATNTITGGTTGLLVTGAGATIVGNTLATAAFSGQTVLYLDLENAALGGTVLNATAVTFAGNTGTTGTTAQNYAVEAKLHHEVDDPTLGFVEILANNVFVSSTKTIANGINAAVAGNTVNIQAGTYTEAVNDTKGLNLEITAPDTVTINSLTGGSNSTVTLNGAGAMLSTGDSTSTTYAGTITGAGNLVKLGTGTFTLSGGSTYTGTTTVNAGTLSVTGSLAAGGTVTVNNGGTLNGTGTLNQPVIVNSGGTLSPGVSSPGLLTVAGVSFQAGATFSDALNGPTAGTNYGQLVVTSGPVTLGSATLNLPGGNFTPSPGSLFTLISNASGSAVSPSFNALGEGATVTDGSVSGVLTYSGNAGHDVVLAVLGPVALSAGSNGGSFTVQLSGTNLQTLLNGTVTDSRPLSAVSSLTINGANNATNSLTLNFSAGFFSLSGSLSFAGGTGGSDTLSVTGGTLLTNAVTYVGTAAGNLALLGSSSSTLKVNFSNTTALNVAGASNTNLLTFQLPSSSSTVTLDDAGDGASSTLSGGTGSFVPTTYTDPTASLLVTDGSQGDAVTLKRTATTNADYTVDAGGSSDSLTVDLSSQTAADVVYLTANALHSDALDGGLHAIWYFGTTGTFGGGLTVNLGSGGNRVFVQGTAAATPTLVQTGSGNDTIVVSSNPDPTQGTLAAFAGPLTVDGQGGTNLLLVSEAASTTADTVSITSSAINFAAETFTLTYQATNGSFSGIQVASGTGNSTLTVQSQPAGTALSVYGNGGSDTFQVAVTSVSAYANLLLDGSTGNSTLDVFDESGGATATRNLTGGGIGTLQVNYPAGLSSTVNFQNMAQQFANVAIQG